MAQSTSYTFWLSKRPNGCGDVVTRRTDQGRGYEYAKGQVMKDYPGYYIVRSSLS